MHCHYRFVHTAAICPSDEQVLSSTGSGNEATLEPVYQLCL